MAENADNGVSGSVAGGKDLKAELNPYDPPSNTQAYVWAGLIAAFVIVAMVTGTLYAIGDFDIVGTVGIQGPTK